MQCILNRFVFPVMQSSYNHNISYLSFVDRSETTWSTEWRYSIPIRYYNPGYKFTMLMCHGNAVDIGQYDLEYLSQLFGVGICMFDYAGYGLHSCTTPSESNCQKDVIAVYNHLILEFGLDAHSIIIFGRSLGTGVACYLAHYLCNSDKPIKGLILISPLMSIIKIVTNLWIPGDMFQNYLLAPNITCPTLILHGDADRVVPYICGVELSHLFSFLYKFVTLKNRGHNDIETDIYINEIQSFIKYMYIN